jgi:hypothetical protein
MCFFESLEIYLESNGWLKALRRLRTFETMFMTGNSLKAQRNWVRRKLNLEREGCEIAQRETYLKEEIAAWESGSGVTVAGQPAKITAWKKELKQLNKKYWLYEREENRMRLETPNGPVVRAYKTRERTSKITDEYLDCAGVGGCCGRECKCCEQLRNTNRRQGNLIYQHCTIECGCCIRHRGFYKPDLNDSEEEDGGQKIDWLIEASETDDW